MPSRGMAMGFPCRFRREALGRTIMATKFHIGDKVRLSFGNRTVTGTVVEDRGRIGVGGRQLFRIVVKTGDGERALELPAEKLRAA